MNAKLNQLFATLSNLTESSGAIATVADKLLSRVVPQETASAGCRTLFCTGCVFRRKVCTNFCCTFGAFPPCRTVTKVVRC
ncbi:hypothetical protein IFO70_31580 [Phormidium tenue FACHB-886]|nr:hypothetical protein [Phormidium tenue FACHB-886]